MNESQKLEVVRYRMLKAKETLDELDFLILHELYGTAVNRTYYSCFYAVIALLTYHDILTKTHSGTRQMFGLHFIKTGIITENSGSFYKDIFDLRQTGDYEDFIVFDKDRVLTLVEPARILIAEIEQLLPGL